MFERFTTNARSVVVRAQEEARELQHDYIGTEHILLGLYASPASIAAQALRRLGVTAAGVREAVEADVGRGQSAPKGHIPFTKRSKKVLELALREALQLKHNYIGTEHILLAVEREGEGLAAKILAAQLNDLGAIRTTVHELLGSGQQEHPVDASPHRTTAADEVVSAAQALAGAAPMGSHHLLEALIRADGSMAAKVLSGLGIDAAAIAAKVDEIDTEETTDATPEESAARKMELRVVSGGEGDENADEVHLVFRDQATIGLAKALTALVDGPVTGTGPVAGRFVPLWSATNELLMTLLQSMQQDPAAEGGDRGKAALLVRRVLHDRLRRRGGGQAAG
jgi:ATP-dependent Clp protease ATP-binding subunit ClpA